MNIFNGTSHTIDFYDLSQCESDKDGRKLWLKAGEKPIYSLPAGVNLNCQKTNAPSPEGDFPFMVRGGIVFTGYDPIPEDSDLVIVSNLYRSAVQSLGGDTSKLATIDSSVYEDGNPRPVGCIGLAIG
jgi:hypothetical protein